MLHQSLQCGMNAYRSQSKITSYVSFFQKGIHTFINQEYIFLHEVEILFVTSCWKLCCTWIVVFMLYTSAALFFFSFILFFFSLDFSWLICNQLLIQLKKKKLWTSLDWRVEEKADKYYDLTSGVLITAAQLCLLVFNWEISNGLKDHSNANTCWPVLIYAIFIITCAAKRISKRVSYIL